MWQSMLVFFNPIKFGITFTFGNLLSLGRCVLWLSSEIFMELVADLLCDISIISIATISIRFDSSKTSSLSYFPHFCGHLVYFQRLNWESFVWQHSIPNRPQKTSLNDAWPCSYLCNCHLPCQYNNCLVLCSLCKTLATLSHSLSLLSLFLLSVVYFFWFCFVKLRMSLNFGDEVILTHWAGS